MRNKSGYTLIELVLIIVIIGIMAAIAIPRFTNVKKLSYVTARELVSDLRDTRSLAINKGVVHYLEFFESNTKYRIIDTSDGSQVGDDQLIPDEVICTPDDTIISFNYLGTCTNGDNSITLVGEGETHTVNIVGFTGRASSQ